LNAAELNIDNVPVPALVLAAVARCISDGVISNNAAKQLFTYFWDKVDSESWTGDTFEDINSIVLKLVDEQGLKQMSDSGELEKIIDDVLAANAKNVEEIRAGITKAMNALVGQAMKATKGKANPAQVNELLKRKIG
jgi:aspartyl-tRNA(Asn)/glutamyl-tRNA(Gln) amidotransferase subunit B